MLYKFFICLKKRGNLKSMIRADILLFNNQKYMIDWNQFNKAENEIDHVT